MPIWDLGRFFPNFPSEICAADVFAGERRWPEQNIPRLAEKFEYVVIYLFIFF